MHRRIGSAVHIVHEEPPSAILYYIRTILSTMYQRIAAQNIQYQFVEIGQS